MITSIRRVWLLFGVVILASIDDRKRIDNTPSGSVGAGTDPCVVRLVSVISPKSLFLETFNADAIYMGTPHGDRPEYLAVGNASIPIVPWPSAWHLGQSLIC